jgi:hypothetical protein
MRQTIPWTKEIGPAMIYKTLHRKLKVEQYEPIKHPCESVAPERC